MEKHNKAGMLLALACLAVPAQAAQYELLHDSSKIKVDGQLDEAVWQQATQINLAYEAYPNHGDPARIRTEAFLYEDGEYLYIAFKAYDDNPELIRSAFRPHDGLFQDDNVGIIIDTFGAQRTGFEFFVNPYGAQADMLMDDNDGWSEDESWDAIWDSAGQITEFGYQVEVAIPFKALRFPETGQPQTWNIALWRNHPRDIKSSATNFPRDRDSKCSICQFDQIRGFNNIKQGHNLQLTPTLTLGRADSKNAQGDWVNGDAESDVGLDIRWGMTQDIVLNATINPDFSNVEADDGQLDINKTFALFYNEKRPFFLDGSDYFSSNQLNLVHTRNIVDPDVGAKITGKINSHSFGVMMADDKRTDFLLPFSESSDIVQLDSASKSFVGRYKSDVGERSSAGVLLTSRSADDYRNDMLAVDGVYNISDAHQITYLVARSESDNPLQVQQDYGLAAQQTDNAVSLNYQYFTGDDNIYVEYNRIGQDFRADMGFVGQSDYQKLVVGGGHNWYLKDNKTVNRVRINGDWDKTYRLSDDQLLEQEIEGYINLWFNSYSAFVSAGVLARERHYAGELFDEYKVSTWLEGRPIADLYVSLYVSHGDSIDYDNVRLGQNWYVESVINWQISDEWELLVGNYYDTLDIDGSNLYNAYLADAVLSYQFDMRNQIRLNVQYTHINRTPGLYLQPEDYADSESYVQTQLLYSYKVNPQTLIYVGYGDFGLDTAESNGYRRTDRQVFAKFSYAWQY